MNNEKKSNIIKIVCIVIAVIIVVCVLVVAYRQMTFNKIDIVSGKQFVVSCPKRARPGQEVKVEVVAVCDADLYVNGVDGEFQRDGTYKFIMPNEDVKLKVTVISNGMA